ncbi:MAG: MauE/DoxX family redox-associated membrane protein [Dongiaceae bacterium]
MEMLDPVWVWIARLSVTVLFAAAGLSKLWQQAAFRDAVGAYDLLPRRAIAPVALVLAATEVAAAILLLWPAARWTGAILLGGLLLLFSAAIAINLARGRTDIDCGCWLFGARQTEYRRGIGGATLARNAGLAALVLVASLPAQGRALAIMDWSIIVGGALAALGLLMIAAQLAANGRRLASLRAARS